MPANSVRLKFHSLNVNGLRSPTKRRAIFKYLRKSESDIIFLQETHSTSSDQKIWSSEWGGRIIYSHGLSNSKGVCNTEDSDGRFLVVQLQHQSEILALVYVYAPTQSKLRNQLAFMDTLDSVLADLDAHNLFIGVISMPT